MLLAADANVLFSFFKKDSTTRALTALPKLELVSPKFALSELDKYKSLIMEKSDIEEREYEFSKEILKEFVEFIPLEEFVDLIERAKEACPKIEDIQYFALALKLGCPLWSNEVDLKKQSEVRVLSTREIIELLRLG